MDNPFSSFRRSFRLTLAERAFEIPAFPLEVREFARYCTGESAHFYPGHKEAMLRTVHLHIAALHEGDCHVERHLRGTRHGV